MNGLKQSCVVWTAGVRKGHHELIIEAGIGILEY